MRPPARRLAAVLTELTGTGAGAGAVLAVLVVASVFVAVAIPRASLSYRTRALQDMVAATPASDRTVSGAIDMPTLGAAFGPLDQVEYTGMNGAEFGPVGAELARHLRADGIPLTPKASWWGVATSFMSAPGTAKSAYFGDSPPQVELIDRSRLRDNGTVIAGKLPSQDSLGRGTARFDVAVTPATARRFSLRPGSTIGLTDSDVGSVRHLVLDVTGIVRPRHPQSAFWTTDPNAAAPSFNKTSFSGYYLGGMIIGDTEMNDLEVATSDQKIRVTWVFPLMLTNLSADQAVGLDDDFNKLASAGVLTKSVTNSTLIPLNGSFQGSLIEFVSNEAELGTLLSLLYVSLTAVGLVVLLLGARLLAERRAAEFGLIRARGATRRQVALVAARASAVVVLPAALVGLGAAVLATPGQDEPLGWWLGAITCLVALGSVPWLALRHARLVAQRADTPPPRQVRARRVVIDVCAVLIAVLGLVVLRLQGQPTSGTDWLTSAAPVLVAIPLAIVVVRAYPVVLRWLVALAGRRQGVPTFIGLARATRASASAVLPAFALVLALGVIAFGAMLRTAVIDGDVAASWRAVGADVVIDASGSNNPLTPNVARVIAGVPGVTASAVASIASGTAPDGSTIGVIALDPARYAALLAQTPARPLPRLAAGSGSALPALGSPGAVSALGHSDKLVVGSHPVTLALGATITSAPGFPAIGPFVVVPQQAADRLLGGDRPVPTVMLLAGAVDHRRLQAAVRLQLPGATSITYRSTVLAALTGADLQRGAYVTFAQAAVAAAGFGAVIMLIMLALGARARELTLARLFTMGLSRGQARLLVSAEALPAIVAAAVGGAFCAWALVPLLAPSIDLSVFTRTTAGVPFRADFAVIGYLAAALIVLALGMLFAQNVASRLRGVSRALRVGE